MWFKPIILVVDDDLQVLNLLGEVLAGSGAVPRCVPSATQAAALIDREKFDAFFLDWLMPDMDGLALAERVRWSKTNSRCPIVMLTGVTDPDGVKECFRHGVNFFLNKPVSVERIQRLLTATHGLMVQQRLMYQRVSCETRVVCHWSLDRYQQVATGRSINLSAGGMLVKLDTLPPPNALVHVEFTLPEQALPLMLMGRVVRLAPEKQWVGVQFIETPRSARQQLMDFIQRELEMTEIDAAAVEKDSSATAPHAGVQCS